MKNVSMNFRQYLIFLPLTLAIFFLTIGINKPFIGQHDFNNVQEGNIAKNYLKYGVWDLKFGQVLGQIQGDVKKQTSFYTSYLPGLSLMVAFSYTIFGISEWSQRVVPILLSLLGLVYFYKICQVVWGEKIALVAGLFYSVTPMFIYYGKMAVFDPVILSFIVASYYYFLRWLRYGKSRDLWFCSVAVLMGGLVGWIIGYITILVIFQSVLLRKFSKKIVLPFFVFLITFYLLFLHAYILYKGDLLNSSLLYSFKNRTSGLDLSFGGLNYSLRNYIRLEISVIQAYFTRTLVVLSMFGIALELTAFFKDKKTKFNLQNTTLLVLFCLGLAHPILFSKVVFIHDYENMYLLPFFAVVGSLGTFKILQVLNKFKISQLNQFGVIILLVLLVFIERWQFTNTLLQTSNNSYGLEMSKVLNKLQKDNNQAVIISPRFNSFHKIFSDYYSKFSYQVLSEEEIPQLTNYKYIITIDQDISPKNYQVLINRYKYERISDITVFYTNDR
jgi:4-amino-4-deoxy-L-arabinose transferase-like glycosyltransferase